VRVVELYYHQIERDFPVFGKDLCFLNKLNYY